MEGADFGAFDPRLRASLGTPQMTETANTFLARAQGQVVTVQFSDASTGYEPEADASSRGTPLPSVGAQGGGSLARDH